MLSNLCKGFSRLLVAAALAWCVAGGAVAPPASAPATSAAATAPAPAVVVLPLAVDRDEPSATDEDYGQRVAFAIAAKWRRIKGWAVIDRFTIAGAMSAAKLARGSDPDRKALAEMVRGRLLADVVVFGSVSGAGAEKTIAVRVVDYRGADGVWPGTVALDKTYKMAYWTDLRFILADAVAAATGAVLTTPSEDLAILDPASAAMWKDNPNLVPNPRFLDGGSGRLSRWQAVIESHRYNPPWTGNPAAPIQEDREKMVLWSPVPAEAAETTRPADQTQGKAVQFALPRSVAAVHGLSCYSDWIEAKPGHRYRCAITYASKGPTFLPFVKGYALIAAAGQAKPQRREVYRRQFPKLKSTNGQWKTQMVDFVPSVIPPKDGHRRPYELKWIRVDLYCYWPQGHVWVKDVTVKLVQAPEPGGSVLDPMTPAPVKKPQ